METILERVGQVWQPTSYGNNPGGIEWTGIRVAALVVSQAARLKGEAASVGRRPKETHKEKPGRAARRPGSQEAQKVRDS
jgi:hypothetical protein